MSNLLKEVLFATIGFPLLLALSHERRRQLDPKLELSEWIVDDIAGEWTLRTWTVVDGNNCRESLN